MLVNTLSLVKYCNEIELVDNKVYNFSDKNITIHITIILCHDFFCLKIFVHSQHCIIHSLAIQFYFSYMVQAVLLLKSILRKSSFAYFLLIFILYTGILFPYYFIFAERSLVQI